MFGELLFSFDSLKLGISYKVKLGISYKVKKQDISRILNILFIYHAYALQNSPDKPGSLHQLYAILPVYF